MIKTCSADEEDNCKNKIENYIIDSIIVENENIFEKNKPLYTLIWYDCVNCKKLLDDMDKLHLKKIYVNEGLFYDITDLNKKYVKPLLYRNSDFIGDTLFDIYTAIYSEN